MYVVCLGMYSNWLSSVFCEPVLADDITNANLSMNVEPVLADDITNANLSMNVQDSTLTTIVTEAGSIFFFKYLKANAERLCYDDFHFPLILI